MSKEKTENLDKEGLSRREMLSNSAKAVALAGVGAGGLAAATGGAHQEIMPLSDRVILTNITASGVAARMANFGFSAYHRCAN